MATVSNTSKFITLDGMNVFYDEEKDVILLTAVDSDLIQSPFSISVEKGSQADTSLRELLAAKSFTVKTDETVKDSIFLIPFGHDNDKHHVVWDASTVPHAVIAGSDEDRADLVYDIVGHCIRSNIWDVFTVDLSETNSEVVYRQTISDVHDLMMKRYEAVMSEDAESFDALSTDASSERVLVVLNGDFLHVGSAESVALTKKIISLGSSVNIHVLLSVEQVEPLLVNSIVDDSFTTVLFDVNTSHAYRSLFGSASTTTWHSDHRMYVRSDGLLVDGEVVREVVPLFTQ